MSNSNNNNNNNNNPSNNNDKQKASKYKQSLTTLSGKFCLKLRFKNDQYFCNITESRCF